MSDWSLLVKRLRVIENNLLPLVLVAATAGLVLPGVGVALSGLVTPLLALMMLAVAMTFDLATLRRVFKRPGVQALATGLVRPDERRRLATGPAGIRNQCVRTLVRAGRHPAHRRVLAVAGLHRPGQRRIGHRAQCHQHRLAPLLVPALFLLYTGVELDMPVAARMGELAITVIVPTVVGVAIRTRWTRRIEPVEPVLSATASLAYLLLVVAVVGPNAAAILAQPTMIAAAAAVALVLNAFGYLLGWSTKPLLAEPADRTAMLFTISKKEFSIAAFVASGLPPEVALPAVVFAVVQMITSPVFAKKSSPAARRPRDPTNTDKNSSRTWHQLAAVVARSPDHRISKSRGARGPRNRWPVTPVLAAKGHDADGGPAGKDRTAR